MQQNANSAVKNDSNKAKLNLLPFDALTEVTKAFEHGADKYGAYNWLKGMNHSRLFAACLRHLFAYWEGEDVDSESHISHLAAAASNVLMLLSSKINNVGTDDRKNYTADIDAKNQRVASDGKEACSSHQREMADKLAHLCGFTFNDIIDTGAFTIYDTEYETHNAHYVIVLKNGETCCPLIMPDRFYRTFFLKKEGNNQFMRFFDGIAQELENICNAYIKEYAAYKKEPIPRGDVAFNYVDDGMRIHTEVRLIGDVIICTFNGDDHQMVYHLAPPWISERYLSSSKWFDSIIKHARAYFATTDRKEY